MSSNSGDLGENTADVIYIIVLEEQDFTHTCIYIHMGGVSYLNEYYQCPPLFILYLM